MILLWYQVKSIITPGYMARTKFQVVKGKWQLGNLNDKLVAASFDVFINLRREKKHEEKRVKKNLSIHNYKFNYEKSNDSR